MREMKSLTLNGETYDSFVDTTARALSAGSAIIGEGSGEVITAPDASKYNLLELHIYGKTTQDGTPTLDAPVELVSVGDIGSVGVKVCGKNILKNAATVKSMNGVEFTVNADGSMTANGTANADILFTINSAVYGIIPGESYTISGCPNVNGVCRLYFAQHNDAGAIANANTYDTGSGATAKIRPECKYLWVGFYVKTGTVFSSATIYPMIRLASVTDAAYKPYEEQTLTVSTPNGLPGIPVTTGGNYTDANGQQWVCDEIDFARGMRITRVVIETVKEARTFAETPDWAGRFVCGSFISSNCKSGTAVAISNFAKWKTWGTTGIPGEECFAISGRNLYYTPSASMTADEIGTMFAEMIASDTPPVIVAQLEAPNETLLSKEELAAYADLHTYKDNTTVSNDAGAYMELEYVMDAKKYIDNKISTGILEATLE